LQASNAFASAGAAAPEEFYDPYTMDLEPEGQWARASRRFRRHRLAVVSLVAGLSTRSGSTRAIPAAGGKRSLLRPCADDLFMGGSV
jgi:hypothetical protein